ncbi:MAG TPA: NAD(P)H-dependent oxidoreductase, partial [Candidatus Bathyarchaeia archaeon]|nr:NAD(P)H-dependent oxidoreductase [Candidatus Bathyarchaeia archaeon]
EADAIVMATPLYFFAMSAQLKMVFDRMFCLYKWDNAKGTMQTPLKGKTLVLIASAFEDEGLDALTAPFQLTAEYSGMKFDKLLIAHAGVSGEVVKHDAARKQAIALGQRVAAA